jgi:hypothetical protein
MNRLITAIATILTVFTAMSQQVDTQVHIFDSNVKSLKVCLESNSYFPPVIVMNSDDRLLVNFDYLDYDVHYLRYSITHCNANWQPSQLVESEYVNGFNYADITNYAQSAGTFAHYVNYSFSLPNENMQITKSGNYLLTVYPQDNQDKILFQTRFSVCENVVSVFPEVTSRTDIDYNETHQQVAFNIQGKNYTIRDPYNELTAVVTQNSRTDNEVTLTRPMMVSGNVITYSHNNSLIFPAGNEFRRIETTSVNSMNMGVEKMQYFEPYYHATLRTDEMRDESSYLYDQTQYGRFTIRSLDADDSSIGADYVVTHFNLNTDGQLDGGNIFLYGEFTDGLPASSRVMRYDAASGTYTCDLLLKQGAYNYEYLWVPDGKSVGETGKIEGDKYQTINEYLVKVYDRPMGERYDHFIGYGIIFSGK